MKKDFNDAHEDPSAIELVMRALLARGSTEGPYVLAEAVASGLARRFQFYISEVASDIGDGARYAAVIYPLGKDSTFKCLDVIRAMLPDAVAVDGNSKFFSQVTATEWHLPPDLDTPGKIAKYLSKQGFHCDFAAQAHDAKILRAVNIALTGAAAKIQGKPRKP